MSTTPINFSARSEALLHWAADEFGNDQDGFHDFLQDLQAQVLAAGIARLGVERTYVLIENTKRLACALVAEAEA
jgi:hypothetical protein